MRISDWSSDVCSSDLNEPNRTADEYAVWLLQLMQLQGLDRESIEAVIIGTVVPASLFNLMTLSRRYFHCEPLVIGDPQVKLGMRVMTLNPAEVGADRIDRKSKRLNSSH